MRGLVTGIWLTTAWRATGGSVVLGPLTVLDWQTVRTIENGLVANRASVVCPLAEVEAYGLQAGHVTRWSWRDGATGAIEEFSVIRWAGDAVGKTARLELEGPEFELGYRESVLYERRPDNSINNDLSDTGVTPATALARVIAAAPSYWQLGTVTPVLPVAVAYPALKPLAAGLAIAEASALAEGVAAELSVTQSATAMTLDFGVFNGAAISADLRPSKNLFNVARTEDASSQATRIFLRDPLGLRRPHYQVTAIVGNDITIMDVSVLDLNQQRGGAVRENGQLESQVDGAQWVELKNGTPHTIGVSVRTTYAATKLTLASAAGIAFGDLGYLTDGNGNDFAFIDAPSLIALYGGRVPPALDGVDGLMNAILNGEFAGGTPTTANWWNLIAGSFPTGTFSTVPGTWREGGRSLVLKLTGVGPVYHADQVRVIHCVAGEVWSYTIWFQIAVVGHGGNQVNVYDPDTGLATALQFNGLAPYNKTDVWYSRTVPFTIATTGNKTFRVELIGDNSTPTGIVYLDAVQLIQSPTEVPFRRGSGAAKNLASINATFDANGMPLETFDLDPEDLSIKDPVGAASDALQLGAKLYLSAPQFGTTRRLLRVVSETRSKASPARPALVVSTQIRKLASFLAGFSL